MTTAAKELQKGRSKRLIDKYGVIQTVLFSKRSWTPAEARKLLRRFNRKTGIDTRGKFHRFRQRTPGKFYEGSLRNVSTRYSGIRVIVGRRKNNPKKKNPKDGLFTRILDSWLAALPTP